MCDCHPMTPDERKAWDRIKREPATKDDWKDLHDSIEEYKRRRMDRHLTPSGQFNGAVKP